MSGKKYTILDMQAFAATKNGKCLSEAYLGLYAPLDWQCQEGHQWSTRPVYIEKGSWCPTCARNIPLKIEDMQQWAQSRGGRCLSTAYLRSNVPLLWQCALGHEWKTRPNTIQRGRWCPYCGTGLGERICRTFFEQLFQAPFPKVRPRWLRSLTGHLLELDGYAQALGLAFEHQGIQHYTQVRYLHRKQRLGKIQENDALKIRLCKENGVALVVVPSVLDIIGTEHLKSFIRKAILELNRELPHFFDEKQVDMADVYSPKPLKQLQDIALQRGGLLISGTYLGAYGDLEWECRQGHRWHAKPHNIKAGHWCPVCNGGIVNTIHDMHVLAATRNGKCLSDIYINKKTHLLWECEYGHQWHGAPSNVQQGNWCPQCGQKQRWSTRKAHNAERLQDHQIVFSFQNMKE